MKKYRKNLPQLNGREFLTDGGLETTLIFHQGMELPHFASFDILNDPYGEAILKEYYENYIEIARKHGMGFVLESPTWRASRDWGYLLGYSAESLTEINHKAIAQLEQIRSSFEEEQMPMVVSGCIGPRGDGYLPDKMMSVSEALEYHSEQIRVLGETNADMISAFTINYSNEAIGMALAAMENQMPIVIGFTVETDGKLPSGESLKKAIDLVDKSTGDYPVYYMINCAHPTHFRSVLEIEGKWKNRIMAIRANASKKSHAELDQSDHLDSGDKCELARGYAELRKLLPNLKVIGGCCGTDHTHIEEICRSWFTDVA